MGEARNRWLIPLLSPTTADGCIEVGDADVLSVPADTPTWEFTGLTIMPGLLDCHVHLVFSAGINPLADVQAEDNSTLLLRAFARAPPSCPRLYRAVSPVSSTPQS
jgi:imidazolonepropionase-like amidohydrolase